MSGGVQLWVTAAARLLPPPPLPVGQPSAGVSAAAAPRPPCPGRSRPAACGHRAAAPVVSAIGEAAIALQLMSGYLQAPDRCGHPLRWRRIIAGQSRALKAGTARAARGFLPPSCGARLDTWSRRQPVL